MAHNLARAEPFILAFDYDADRGAIERLANLEGRHIAFSTGHAAAHVRVNGEPPVGDEQLSSLWRGEILLDEFEVVGLR